MNPNFRKAALVAAALGLIVSLYLALSPGGDDEAEPATTAAQTTAPATTEEQETTPATTAPAATAPAEPQVVRATITVPGDRVPPAKKLTVQRGRQVELTIESQLADEVHLHGYDLSADVAPGEPATISFEATAPGRFEIELESRGLQIAELEVRP